MLFAASQSKSEPSTGWPTAMTPPPGIARALRPLPLMAHVRSLKSFVRP